MSSALAIPQRLSFEEFLDWALKQERRVEWADGEVIYLSPVSNRHDEITTFLITLLNIYVKWKNLGRVFHEEFLVKLPGIGRSRLPDIFFVASENADRVRNTYLEGAPDLAVEVVSLDSIDRDRREKRGEYARAGVREYWIVDPLENEVIFYRLSEKGKYKVVEPDERGRFESAVIPGLWIDVEWLRSHPVPNEMTVLKAWGLM